jgi:hypothetical protein
MYQLLTSCSGSSRPSAIGTVCGPFKDGDALDPLGVPHRQRPREAHPHIVPDDARATRARALDQRTHVLDEPPDSMSLDTLWLLRKVMTAEVRRDDTKARRGQRRDLTAPGVPELGETHAAR